MELEVVSAGIGELDADLVAIALAEGDELPDELRSAPGAGDARTAFKRQALIHPGQPETRASRSDSAPPRSVDAERLRVAGALAAKRAAALEARSLAWLVPAGEDVPERAAALAEGISLATYRFDRYRSGDADDPAPPRLERLVLVVAEGDGEAVQREAAIALLTAAAANRARELQNLPANELTPEALAERARRDRGRPRARRGRGARREGDRRARHGRPRGRRPAAAWPSPG